MILYLVDNVQVYSDFETNSHDDTLQLNHANLQRLMLS